MVASFFDQLFLLVSDRHGFVVEAGDGLFDGRGDLKFSQVLAADLGCWQ
jgi:hypothetical protein